MSVKVRVILLGTFREASGIDELEFEFPIQTDIAGVVEDLLRRGRRDLRKELVDPLSETPLPNALILINGIEINNLDGLKTRVRDGDIITLLPVVHGG